MYLVIPVVPCWIHKHHQLYQRETGRLQPRLSSPPVIVIGARGVVFVDLIVSSYTAVTDGWLPTPPLDAMLPRAILDVPWQRLAGCDARRTRYNGLRCTQFGTAPCAPLRSGCSLSSVQRRRRSRWSSHSGEQFRAAADAAQPHRIHSGSHCAWFRPGGFCRHGRECRRHPRREIALPALVQGHSGQLYAGQRRPVRDGHARACISTRAIDLRQTLPIRVMQLMASRFRS